MMNSKILFTSLVAAATLGASAQVNVDNTLTPEQLVQNVLLGSGVTVSNIMFNGAPGTTVSPQAAAFSVVNSNLGLNAGGVALSSGYVATDDLNFITGVNGPATSFAANGMGTGYTDPDLVTLSGQSIFDASVLEFDFIPTGDSIKFRFVFGSEEYPGYTCSNFNDAFGFFLSGPGIIGPYTNNAINIALVPGTQIPIAINTVNSGVSSNGSDLLCQQADPNWQNNSIYFVDNAGQGGTTITYDGFTTVIMALAQVQCGQTYHIKLAIGDGSDSTLDSGVFLEAGSFSSTPFIPTLTPGPGIVGTNTILESCLPVTIDFNQQGASDDTSVVYIQVGGTSTPGVDYSPAFPDSLVFYPGDSTQSFTFNVPVDPDGQETIILTLTSQSPCAGILITNEFIFYIESAPALVAVGNNATIPCLGTADLTPVVTGGYAPYSITWSNQMTGPSITVSPLVATTYIATIVDDCGST
ncbi:MAG TPA: choice-of-anchor L domain-containing protein, partial [Flavobacteriales bacterium]|nr:choice-of-anchor L domain-containing protein [Flavobacteriales bacterium]